MNTWKISRMQMFSLLIAATVNLVACISPALIRGDAAAMDPLSMVDVFHQTINGDEMNALDHQSMDYEDGLLPNRQWVSDRGQGTDSRLGVTFTADGWASPHHAKVRIGRRKSDMARRGLQRTRDKSRLVPHTMGSHHPRGQNPISCCYAQVLA